MVIESQPTEIETVCESEDKFCPLKKKKKKKFSNLKTVLLIWWIMWFTSVYTLTLPLLLHDNIYNK